MAKGDDIQERLVDFAVEIIELTSHYPDTKPGSHISGQILRSGTSPAPNYAEARGAESKRDFIHKLRIVLKELNETDIWLRITIKSKLLEKSQCAAIHKECQELCKIIGTSIRTARNHSK